MTKELARQWLRECVLTSEMPDELLLVLDEWTSFKNHRMGRAKVCRGKLAHKMINELVPRGKEAIITNIPGGATSLMQSLGVFFFSEF